MKYENRIVLFLDILGFRSIVDQTVEGEIDKSDEIDILYSNLNYIEEFFSHKLVGGKLSATITQFSDSIIISFSVEESKLLIKLIETIQEFVMHLIYNNLLCRGAISFGKLIHTDRIVFGPALNDAYETETKAALYPRVILDRTVIDVVRKNRKTEKLLFGGIKSPKQYFFSCLKKDTDDKYYVDYFPTNILLLSDRLDIIEYLKNLRRLIVNGGKSNKPDLKVKYGWMKNKYNRLLTRLGTVTFPIELTSKIPQFYKFLNETPPLK
ncbi:MAG TPA: hypothetical protein VE978_26265 [Chitinophagales bacterium]|nr:hypothetical protein [Chitinophagales bacterium]